MSSLIGADGLVGSGEIWRGGFSLCVGRTGVLVRSHTDHKSLIPPAEPPTTSQPPKNCDVHDIQLLEYCGGFTGASESGHKFTGARVRMLPERDLKVSSLRDLDVSHPREKFSSFLTRSKFSLDICIYCTLYFFISQ